MAKKVRGRSARMTRADRLRRDEHKEHTDAKGKKWTNKHVKDEVTLAQQARNRIKAKKEKEERDQREMLKRLVDSGFEIVGDTGTADTAPDGDPSQTTSPIDNEGENVSEKPANLVSDGEAENVSTT